MRKKVLTLLLAISMLISVFSFSAFATQSKSGNFSRNYKLTGKAASNLAAVATAQIGKTQKNLGYTEAWCADFATDCARLTGMSSKVIPYTYSGRGSCQYLWNYMKNNCGAKEVSKPKQGDLVFYYCKSHKRFVHVGVVVSGNYSVEGNLSSRVQKRQLNASFRDCSGHTISSGKVQRKYLRPNYSSSSAKPSTPSAKPSTPSTASSTYYQVPTKKYTSIVDALKSIGVTSTLSHRKTIASANSISKYSGTAAQNSKLLNLLYSGKLKRDSCCKSSGSSSTVSKVSYFKKCSASYTSLVDALKSIKADSSFNYRKKIASANGVSNYSGTAAQNSKLLKLLKAGTLKKP